MKLTKTLTAGIMAAGLAFGLATPANAAGSSTATQNCGGVTATISMHSGGQKASTSRPYQSCTGLIWVKANYKRPGQPGIYHTKWKYGTTHVEWQPGNVSSGNHKVTNTNGVDIITRTT